MLGEEIPIEKLPYDAPEVSLALSNIMSNRLVYLLGPGGKTAALRALAVMLYKAGMSPLYVKLEWVKYGWSLDDYITRHLDTHLKLVGYPAPREHDAILLDDAELVAEYPRLYEGFVGSIREKVRAVAAREGAVEHLAKILGDGIPIKMNFKPGEARRKLPLGLLGLASLGQIVEVEII